MPFWKMAIKIEIFERKYPVPSMTNIINEHKINKLINRRFLLPLFYFCFPRFILFYVLSTQAKLQVKTNRLCKLKNVIAVKA